MDLGGERQRQGSERDRVARAATQAVGGTAVDVETSDDRGEAYEVEVRLDDGTEVDVSLDKDLTVVSQEAEGRDDTEDGDRDDSTDAPENDDRALSATERASAEKAALNAVHGGTVTEVEASDDRGEAYKVQVRLNDGTEVDVSLDKDLTVVSQEAEGRDDTEDGDRDDSTDAPENDDRALSATERASAEKAALNAVHGGTVTEVEASDDRGEAYEVEVRLGDGTEWDVELDADFKVLSKSIDN